MGEIVTFFLALIFVGIGWGWKTLIWIIAAWIFVAFLGKRRFSFGTNWANIAAKYCIIILSFFAIQDKWHNPVITAISIAVAILLVVLGR
jgi:hypothetical protein